jgi:hypothetical protein
MRESVTDLAAIAAEIARIRALAPDALGRRCRAVFGRKPPASLSRELLGRMIAMWSAAGDRKGAELRCRRASRARC